MAKKKSLTPAKAREILHDKSVHGHPLTDKQKISDSLVYIQ